MMSEGRLATQSGQGFNNYEHYTLADWQIIRGLSQLASSSGGDQVGSISYWMSSTPKSQYR